MSVTTAMASDESDLIAQARRGSTVAFEQLYRMHSARVYGLCLRLSDTAADAQDATQETFIKAWRALETFNGSGAFSTWLHRIAFNETIGIKRRRRSEGRHLQPVGAEESCHDVALPEMERIERAVASLPDRAREALVLTRIYGYTYEETAAFMEIAVGTAKAQVHRAVRLFRDAMAASAGPPESNASMRPAEEVADDE